jgi:PAS domain S-box-containing protein
MNKLLGSNDTEGTPLERPGILEGLATRLQEGLRATIVALGQSHAQRLAAIVESSDDAILSVDLDGIIATWNRGAETLLGYTADEVIGKPVTMLIPADKQDDEPKLLERIRRGERVRDYETERLRKDGRPVSISLSVSPILDAGGTIIGASKIGRDITERKRAEESRELLLQESRHRIKNTLATVQAIAGQTLRHTPADEQRAFVARLHAMGEAHDLLTNENWDQAPLRDVVSRALKPFESSQRERFAVEGPDVWVPANTSLLLTLALHELATNAAKYGALSNGTVQVRVSWELATKATNGEARKVKLSWVETGGPPVTAPERKGFGSLLIEQSFAQEGETHFQYEPDGLKCSLEVSQ